MDGLPLVSGSFIRTFGQNHRSQLNSKSIEPIIVPYFGGLCLAEDIFELTMVMIILFGVYIYITSWLSIDHHWIR